MFVQCCLWSIIQGRVSSWGGSVDAALLILQLARRSGGSGWHRARALPVRDRQSPLDVLGNCSKDSFHPRPSEADDNSFEIN